MDWEFETILFRFQEAWILISASYTFKELRALSPLPVIFADIRDLNMLSQWQLLLLQQSDGITKVTHLPKIKHIQLLSMSYGKNQAIPRAIYLFFPIILDSVKARKFWTLFCTHVTTTIEISGTIH